MRLICPNCGAQYEVAEDVIPAAGRDVQCSNCAHTWFETPGASEAREAGEVPTIAAVADPEPVSEATETEAVSQTDEPAEDADTPDESAGEAVDTGPDAGTPDAEGDGQTEAEPEEASETDKSNADEDGPQTGEGADTGAPQRRPLSPSVAEILREEAAREEAKRTADADTGLESQPDLGLDRPMDRDEQLAEEARRRMARLKGEAAPAIGAETAVAAGARGEMLPDIDEINSSLRSETERAEGEPKAAQTEAVKRKSGFRRGFMTVILLAVIGLLLYIFAPQISAAVPALEPALTAYVETVNQARLWLDLQLQNLLPGGEA